MKQTSDSCRLGPGALLISLEPLSSLQFQLCGGCWLRSTAGRATSTCTLSASFRCSFVASGSRRCCRSSLVRQKSPDNRQFFPSREFHVSSKDTTSETNNRPVDQ